jgi:hypothetical protein
LCETGAEGRARVGRLRRVMAPLGAGSVDDAVAVRASCADVVDRRGGVVAGECWVEVAARRVDGAPVVDAQFAEAAG